MGMFDTRFPIASGEDAALSLTLAKQGYKMVFTDTAANIERILGIIAKLDQPARRSEIHVVYLKFAQATEMVQILTQLATGMRKTADPKQKRAPSDLTVQAGSIFGFNHQRREAAMRP